jgi:hypothetical protein
MRPMCKLLLLAMGMLLSCSKAAFMDLKDLGGPEPELITMPFTASFTGSNRATDQQSEGCAPGFDHVIEIAYGKGSYVGSSIFYSDFCSNIGTIDQGISYIKSQYGDTLFLTFSGKTCVGLGEKENEKNDHVNEICCWKIPFTILGGTGKLKGATGEGTTDDYLSHDENIYFHFWTGTITLRRDYLQ